MFLVCAIFAKLVIKKFSFLVRAVSKKKRIVMKRMFGIETGDRRGTHKW